MTTARPRYRDLGLTVGMLDPGPNNAITDVDGVIVGLTTLIEGEGPLVPGEGPVRTGVTAILPHADIGAEPVFAGCHRLNGNGELTGLEWVRESGQLTTPIAITNTHSVGVVRDAIVAADMRARSDVGAFWSLPVVGETWDGTLNDINGFHVKPEHLHHALETATTGPVPEGNVGGGTAMICHGFKGGTGTASRTLSTDEGGWTVGALVQANYGRRERLTVDGVPVGREIGPDVVPTPWDDDPHEPAAGRGFDHRRSWRPTRPCSPTSASASRNVPDSGSRASGAPANTRAVICSWPSPPRTAAGWPATRTTSPPGRSTSRCCPTPRSARCSGPRSRPPRKRS